MDSASNELQNEPPAADSESTAGPVGELATPAEPEQPCASAEKAELEAGVESEQPKLDSEQPCAESEQPTPVDSAQTMPVLADDSPKPELGVPASSTEDELAITVEPADPNEIKLIDTDLQQLLAVYGKKHSGLCKKAMIGGFLFGVGIGLASAVIGQSSLALFFLFSLALVGAVHGMLLGQHALALFNKHDYERTGPVLNKAMAWNSIWSPFTYFTLLSCSRIQVQMLSIQNRHAELESLMRIAWASNENSAVHTGIPKDAALANNLACAYLGQRRYREAAEIFQDVIPRTRHKLVKAACLVNLALCYAKTKQIKEASKVLNDNRKLIESHPMTKMRFLFIESMIFADSDHFELAEKSIDELLVLQNKHPESREFLGGTYSILAKVRAKEGRTEEAELYYRNAVDLFKAGNTPAYLGLAEILNDFAELLERLGKLEESHKLFDESEACERRYVEREKETIEQIRSRVTARKPVLILSQILNMDPSYTPRLIKHGE